MNEIIESIRNGQRKQAIEQLKESSVLFTDLIEELVEQDMIDEIPKIIRIAQTAGYITIG
jgi:hypothetical protein